MLKKFKISIILIICCIFLFGCSSLYNSSQNIHAEVADVRMDRKAIVTVVSDDGFYDTGVNLNELSQKHGLKVTVAGIVEVVDPYYEDWVEIENMGHVELISHSYSHLKMSEENNYNEKELRHQITDSINYFRQNFKTDQIAFICPENTMCELGYKILKENNIYAIRQGSREENSLSPMSGTYPSQWYSLYTSGIGDIESTEWRNSVVDSAINNNTWLIEMWHNVYKEGQDIGYQGISYEMADEHMEYLAKKSNEDEIWVASFVDATKYIYEKQNASVSAVLTNDFITISLTTDTDKLPKEIFDYPLTVKIPMPMEWRDDDIVSENKEIDIQIKTINNVEYIVFDMIPNQDKLVIRCK